MLRRMPGPDRPVPQTPGTPPHPHSYWHAWEWSLMGWELRRSAPSDNVMVPATSDPFESPKWAPPVWHMPPVLVLFVKLVGGLGGLVLLLVRHWATALTLAGLGLLVYFAGWPA